MYNIRELFKDYLHNLKITMQYLFMILLTFGFIGSLVFLAVVSISLYTKSITLETFTKECRYIYLASILYWIILGPLYGPLDRYWFGGKVFKSEKETITYIKEDVSQMYPSVILKNMPDINTTILKKGVNKYEEVKNQDDC